MNDYDREYHNPPAPLARVVLGKPGSDAKIEALPMLLDSGADNTVLPGAPCRELGIEPLPDRVMEVASYDGRRRHLYIVQAVIEVQGFVFRGPYLMDQSMEIGVIGRNLLNRVVVELNGPKLIWAMRGT